MKCEIIEKGPFNIIGVSRLFDFERCQKEIPEFWEEHYKSGNNKYVHGMFGICINKLNKKNRFEYLIADVYNPINNIPEGFVIKGFPASTWAVFKCVGPIPAAIQAATLKVFSEQSLIPDEYEPTKTCNFEIYDLPGKYPNGNKDKNYHSEIWIPVQKKQV